MDTSQKIYKAKGDFVFQILNKKVLLVLMAYVSLSLVFPMFSHSDDDVDSYDQHNGIGNHKENFNTMSEEEKKDYIPLQAYYVMYKIGYLLEHMLTVSIYVKDWKPW